VLLAQPPVYPNGYALIGELGKVTRVSVQRFVSSVSGVIRPTPCPISSLSSPGFPRGGLNETAHGDCARTGGVMRGVELSWALRETPLRRASDPARGFSSAALHMHEPALQKTRERV